MLSHHFWAISREIHPPPPLSKLLGQFCILCWSCGSTFRQIAQHHLSHQRTKIVVIRKIILAAAFHFSPCGSF